MFADLLIQSRADQSLLIVVEVKCFAMLRGIYYDFYQAIGQYLVYRNALEWQKQNTPVYLAIPSFAYDLCNAIPALKRTLVDARVKVIVVDLEREEVIRWQR